MNSTLVVAPAADLVLRMAPDPLSRQPTPDHQVGEIAQTAVRLAALVPRLDAVARTTEEQANAQAQTAQAIAAATSALADTLTRVVGELEAAAGTVHDSMRDIVRIAEQTKIIAMNASIEAGRAGDQGRAFAVVAQEIKHLADETRGATHRIDARVTAIHGSVQNVTAIVGTGTATTSDPGVTLDAVDRQIRTLAATASGQREGAKSLHELTAQANGFSEDLLLAVGTLRFDLHDRAARDVALHVASVAATLTDRAALEQKLQRWLRSDPCFELLYVTDMQGRQIVSNIGRCEGEVHADPAGFGRDWSSRPWYTQAMALGGEVHVSDIYRSTATGDFCFTASVQVRNARGQALGVLAADVNFQTLVATDPRQAAHTPPRQRHHGDAAVSPPVGARTPSVPEEVFAAVRD